MHPFVQHQMSFHLLGQLITRGPFQHRESKKMQSGLVPSIVILLHRVKPTANAPYFCDCVSQPSIGLGRANITRALAKCVPNFFRTDHFVQIWASSRPNKAFLYVLSNGKARGGTTRRRGKNIPQIGKIPEEDQNRTAGWKSPHHEPPPPTTRPSMLVFQKSSTISRAQSYWLRSYRERKYASFCRDMSVVAKL